MFRPTLRCSKSSNPASHPTAEEPAPPPLKGKTPAVDVRLQGFSCSVLREGAGFGTAGKTDASISGPGGRKDWAGGARVHLGPAEEGKNGRAKARSGPDEAGQAEQKRTPGRTGACRTGGAKTRSGRADSDCAAPLRAVPCGGQPQGVSAAAYPRRRRRTRRSGTPRGPAPSGRGSRRRWPRCRVRPAGRRFGRRFRPDCAAAAARQPAA